jgi:Uma2 family endonuclease
MENELVAISTIDNFFEQEAKSDFKHEFHGGEVYDMAGAQPIHNYISSNLCEQIWTCQKKKRCKVLFADQLVFAPLCDAIYYPDIVIICENPQFFKHEGTGLYALTNPTVVIEILSESTAHRDRTEKLDCYKTIPSLQEIILIYQTPHKVQHYLRKGDKEWLVKDFTEDNEKILINGCELELGTLYEDSENLPG